MRYQDCQHTSWVKTSEEMKYDSWRKNRRWKLAIGKRFVSCVHTSQGFVIQYSERGMSQPAIRYPPLSLSTVWVPNFCAFSSRFLSAGTQLFRLEDCSGESFEIKFGGTVALPQAIFRGRSAAEHELGALRGNSWRVRFLIVWSG